MAALVPTRPTAAGVAWAPAAVSAEDTIAQSVLGTLGAYLVIINGGGSDDDVTISDAGVTPAGNPANIAPVTVGDGDTAVIYVSPRAANPSTGVVTVTHTSTSDVTYVLLPLG